MCRTNWFPWEHMGAGCGEPGSRVGVSGEVTVSCFVPPPHRKGPRAPALLHTTRSGTGRLLSSLFSLSEQLNRHPMSCPVFPHQELSRTRVL